MRSSLFISFFLFLSGLYSQNLDSVFENATSLNREKRKLEMENTISSEIKSFQTKKNESVFKKSLEYMQILNFVDEEVQKTFKIILNEYQIKSESFLSQLLETIYTISPIEFQNEMQRIAKETNNPKHFAIAIHYLLRLNPEERKNYSDLLKQKFKNIEKNPILKILSTYLEKSPFEYLSKRPPILDLLRHNYGEDTFVVFSFQRANRDYPGLAIIKKKDGSFLRREDGSIFTISQLAKSMSDLPSYITNGNTPQGIFSIQKIQSVKNDLIGPTPALITALPFEIASDVYFQEVRSKSWDMQMYLDILPSSWQSYFPMKEAYYAGEIGRNGIYAHGTTLDSNFYKGSLFFPNSPTRGCLSAKEIWSRKNGKRLYSDQIVLIETVRKLSTSKGYMIVVDLNEESKPVSLDDILMDVLEAEESPMNESNRN
ncbi:MAG TPA: hypothetical protein PK079_02635 [Leptospiraceae bacterium]|nr:hypothetical protein [Leptospiraceae bacterium]HMW04103.1 hypothetical protein [Leptospiraceae bacterium]HMX30830.1 hypothetical protein [Leptospiraceae bacterium]HMY30096.1 hypothetical protein [Leptospiraceae bacterium]HMZ65466.1 hypothetical protein [Leptospiraceae bacterium]